MAITQRGTRRKKKIVRKRATTARARGTRESAGGTHGGDRRSNCRPTRYTPRLGSLVLDRMVDGDSLLRIMHTDPKAPHRATVWHWTQGNLGAPPEFRHDYVRARLLQADGYAERVMATAEGLDESIRLEVERALDKLPGDASRESRDRAAYDAKKRSIEAVRAIVDALKWTSGRMHPRSWGDKLALTGGDGDDQPVRFDFRNASTRDLERIEALERKLGVAQ